MKNEEKEGVWLATMASDKLVLRLPSKAKNVIFPLATARSNEIQCMVLVGKHGQLVVRPADAKPEAFSAIEALLEKKAAEVGDERQHWFEIARLAAASRPARITIEQNGRASLYLPKALCLAPLGPSMGERTVIIAIGAVLEIWALPNWSKWLLANAGSPEITEQRAVDSLGED